MCGTGIGYLPTRAYESSRRGWGWVGCRGRGDGGRGGAGNGVWGVRGDDDGWWRKGGGLKLKL
eukprot:3852966-Rhodomonas_salina.1